MPDLGLEELQIPISDEQGIVLARTQARAVAKALGCGMVAQSRIPTAVSEMTRNADVAAVDEALPYGFPWGRGMGLGRPGTRRLMAAMAIESSLGRGTIVTIRKWLRRR